MNSAPWNRLQQDRRAVIASALKLELGVIFEFVTATGGLLRCLKSFQIAKTASASAHQPWRHLPFNMPGTDGRGI